MLQMLPEVPRFDAIWTEIKASTSLEDRQEVYDVFYDKITGIVKQIALFVREGGDKVDELTFWF